MNKEELMIIDSFTLNKDFKISKSMRGAMKKATIGRCVVYKQRHFGKTAYKKLLNKIIKEDE